jgi:hypothetical protein
MTVLTPARRELYSKIPEQIRCGLVHHFVWGLPLGDFMTAILTNDLRGVFRIADEPSLRGLRAVMTWCYSFGPAPAQGSIGETDAWKGLVNMDLGSAALEEGLEIFAALGDEVAADALRDIRGLTAKGS